MKTPTASQVARLRNNGIDGAEATPDSDTAANGRSGRRSAIWTVARLALSLGLMAVLLAKIQWSEAYALLRIANLWWIGCAFCLAVAAFMIRALKWQVLLRQRGHKVGFWYLFKLYLMSMFWGNFLPLTVGADVVRGIYLASSTRIPAEETAAAIAGDRLTGLIALSGMCGIAALVLGLADATMAGIFIMSLILFLFVVSLFSRRTLRLFQRVLPAWKWLGRAYGAVDRTQHIMSSAVRDTGVLMNILALSLLFQVICVLIGHTVSNGLRLNIPILSLFCYVPCVAILSLLPVSFNGWGIREAAYACLLARAGISYTAAVTFSLAVGLILLVVSFGGGALHATTPLGARE